MGQQKEVKVLLIKSFILITVVTGALLFILNVNELCKKVKDSSPDVIKEHKKRAAYAWLGLFYAGAGCAVLLLSAFLGIY